MMGQIVYRKEYTGVISEYIEVGSFESGTYFISLHVNDKVMVKKLIIIH